MKKRMLEKYTRLYDKVPSWLMIMLSCLIATGFVLIGGLLAGFVVGIPVALVLFVMMLNGSVQPQDINAIAFKLFSSEYFELGVFAFTALSFSGSKLLKNAPFVPLDSLEALFGAICSRDGVSVPFCC